MVGRIGRGLMGAWWLAWGVASADVVEETLPGFDFPRDHGNHPEEPLEWWIFSGHLQAADDRWVAYQLAFYRIDVDTAMTVERGGRWGLRSVYPAAMAITDLDAQRFLQADRLERSGAGTARILSDPVRLLHRDWEIHRDGDHWRLDASTDSLAVSLELVVEKPPISVGADGRGARNDPLFLRYALPRLRTRGTVRMGADTLAVQGVSWLDHLFGRDAIRDGEAGWDFVHLHFRDGAELAIYRTRSTPGRQDRRIGGTYVSASGAMVPLEPLQTRFYPLGTTRWTSPSTGGNYPLRWRIEVPALRLRLDVVATALGQELAGMRTFGANIWRGSVEGSGRRGDHEISTAGFLELVGYLGVFPPRLAVATGGVPARPR